MWRVGEGTIGRGVTLDKQAELSSCKLGLRIGGERQPGTPSQFPDTITDQPAKLFSLQREGTGQGGDLGILGWGTGRRDKGNEGEKGRNRKTWFLTHSTMSPCQV